MDVCVCVGICVLVHVFHLLHSQGSWPTPGRILGTQTMTDA